MKEKNHTAPKNHGAAIVSLAAVILLCTVLFLDRCGGYFKRSSLAPMVNTAEVPAEYLEPSAHPGTVIRIDYPATDYTRQLPVTKPAYVYLPYGYDEAREEGYDVIYLMHGWMMRAQDLLNEDHGIRQVFDHLIECGDTRPFIAVCLTFDAENEPQTYERSVEELAIFQEELREDAIPYLESILNTYAEETSVKGLRASRNHRAFGGFSLGAVTTWHQFLFNLDLIHSFLPMSGDCWIRGINGGLVKPKETVYSLERVIRDGWYGPGDYFIYTGVGTIDPMYEQVNTQVQEMRRVQEFSADNFVYGIKENGYHDLTAVREYLYNALPLLFPNK